MSSLATALAGSIPLAAARAGSDVLKLGVLAPLTGPGAPWGLAIDGAVRIAAKEVNDQGSLEIGGRRYSVEVIAYDDQYKAANAVTAVNRLIGPDDVHFIFGPVGSASLLAIKPLTEAKKTLLFTSSWSKDVLTNSNYIFRVGPTTEEFAPATIAWVKKNRPDVRKVATISANDETGWNSQRIQKQYYTEAGYEIVAAEHFERQQNDFRALITKILASNPDSIELDTTPPPTAGLFVRQARELGFKGLFTKFGGFDVAEIVRNAGAENAEGIVGMLQGDPSSTEWEKFKAAYAEFHKNELNDFVFPYYDVARLLFAALAKVGNTTDSDAIVTALESLAPFPGTRGGLTWGGEKAYGVNHQIYAPVFLVEIKDGKGLVIDKVDIA